VGNGVVSAVDPSGLWIQMPNNQWIAESDEDTFLSLLDLIDPEKKLRPENVMGIIPVKTGDPQLDKEVKDAYDNYTSVDDKPVICGIYDTKHLYPTSGAHIMMAVGTDREREYTKEALKFFKRSFGGDGMIALHVWRESVLENKIKEYSGKGASPIRSLLLIGHGLENSTLMGSLDQDGLVTHSGTLEDNFKWSSYNDAIQSRLSPGFYFATNATIRAVGCNTKAYAESVAANLLRSKDATSFGTNAWTWVDPRSKEMGWSADGTENTLTNKVETAREFFDEPGKWSKLNGPGR